MTNKGLINLLKRLAPAGGKESMSKQGDNATTPAASGGINQEQLEAAIGKVLGPITQSLKDLGDNQKVLADTLAKLPPATEKKQEGEAPLTATVVQKLITDAITSTQQTNQQTAQRDRFVGEKMKDLPEVYRKQLGSDPAKWASEEQEIRKQYQADFKVTGGTVQDRGGAPAGGVKPGAAVDLSKMSPSQLMAKGIEASKPVGSGVASAGAGAAAAAGTAA